MSAIGARLKNGRGWSDVVIRNVSSRGVMGHCEAPPARGEYVEVRCGPYVIVARVAWSGEDSFGARAQDRIMLADLVASSEGRAVPTRERRRAVRSIDTAPRRPSFAERAGASARAARAIDFLVVALAGAALALVAADAVHDAMARPADEVSRALSKAARS